MDGCVNCNILFSKHILYLHYKILHTLLFADDQVVLIGMEVNLQTVST